MSDMPPEPSGLPELHPAVIGEITAQLVDPLARRVVEVMHEQGLVQPRPKPKAWLDAAELAEQLGVTRAWVYQHASELGATRIGNGPRPRLRFPSPALDSPANSARPRRAQRPRARAHDGLLPVRDD